MSEEYEKLIEFAPAWDKRDPDPKKDYGINGLEIRFTLKGKEGAVSVDISTGWLLPSTVGINEDTMYNYGRSLNKELSYPSGMMVCYHSPVQHYEEQTKNECEYTTSGFCYSDCSYTYADKLLKRLIEEGESGVWDELSGWYVEQLVTYEPSL